MLSRRVVRELIGWVLSAWLLLLAHRLAFLAVYWVPGTPPSSALSQFILGMRFDWSTMPLLLLPVVVFLPLLARYTIPRTTLLVLSWAWLGYLNTVLIASSFNYGVNNKHLGWEFFAYYADFGTIFSGVLAQAPLLGTAYLLLLPGTAALGFFVERWKSRSWPAADAANAASPDARGLLRHMAGLPSIVQLLAYEVLVIIVIFVAVRGGGQQSPLRVGDAMHADSVFLNNVPLTGLFTIAHDSQDVGDFRQFYEKSANVRYTQNLLGPKESFLSDKYPLVRRMPQTLHGGRPPNVVLVILESFTAKFLARNGGDPKIAPETNALTQKGIYFKRFISSGGRSANGIFCMMSGIPDRAGRTILRSGSVQNRFGGLPMLLKNKGYQTFFVHGGDLSFDHLDTALPHFGIEKALGAAEIEAMGKKRPHAWGFDDETTFDVLLDAMSKAKEPYFASVFTQNTHHPFFVPDDTYRVIGPDVPQHDYLNAYHYTDHVLGDFIRRASKEKAFQNTVFVFVADHASHADLNYMEDREVVFFIYAPGRLAPKERTDIASHLDMLPTILGLAGGGVPYAAMGRDLLQPVAPGKEFAFFAGGSNTDVIGWVEGDVMLVKSFHQKEAILVRSLPPLGTLNDPVRLERYLEKTQNFHQFARSLEKENRIWPDAREMELLSRK